jgi:hypothetical protein
MLAIAETNARFKAERFDRPLPLTGTGRVFLHHFPVLRTGLSQSPSGTSTQRPIRTASVDAHG